MMKNNFFLDFMVIRDLLYKAIIKMSMGLVLWKKVKKK